MKSVHAVYYQGKRIEFENFSDAYMLVLHLRRDGIDYDFRIEGKAG